MENNKLPVYSTSSHTGVDAREFEPADLFCLVLESESHGVSSEIMELAEKNVRIEISLKIESLNVVTFVAILFYELKRK